jgi:hypothetical protein
MIQPIAPVSQPSIHKEFIILVDCLKGLGSLSELLSYKPALFTPLKKRENNRGQTSIHRVEKRG